MLKGFLGSRIYQNSNISPCAITYIKSQMIYGIYIKMVIYYRRFWAWFYTLNLFLSPLPSLTLFLFLQLHPQNHFTCGSNVEEIIHRTGCSIGTQIPCNGNNYQLIQKFGCSIDESIRILYPSSYYTN